MGGKNPIRLFSCCIVIGIQEKHWQRLSWFKWCLPQLQGEMLARGHSQPPLPGRVFLCAASQITPSRDKRWMPEQVYLHPIESTQTPKQSILHPAQADLPAKKKLESVLFCFLFLFVFCFISLWFQAAETPAKVLMLMPFPWRGQRALSIGLFLS